MQGTREITILTTIIRLPTIEGSFGDFVNLGPEGVRNFCHTFTLFEPSKITFFI